jgi:hypothetical protein
LSSERGSFQVRNRQASDLRVEADITLEGRTLAVARLQATGDYYSIDGQGAVGVGVGGPEAGPGEASRSLGASFSFAAEAEPGAASRSLIGFPLEGEGSKRATLEGTLEMSPGRHHLEARFGVPRARFAGVPLTSWTGHLRWNRSRLEVMDARGSVGDGTASVHFEQVLPSRAHPARLELRFRDASITSLFPEVLAAAGDFETRLTGAAELDFMVADVRRARGRWEIVGEPPAEPGPGRTWLRLEAHGLVADGGIDLEELELQTPGLTASVSGSYPLSAAASLTVEADARDLAEVDRLQQIVRTWVRPATPARPLTLRGTARVSGRLEGRLPDLVFSGRLVSADFGFRGVDWGQVSAEGALGVSGVRFDRLLAQKDGGRLRGRGQVSFGQGAFWRRRFDLDGSVQGWFAPDLGRLLPLPWALAGRLSGEGRLGGVGGRLNGEAGVVVERGSLGGRPFDRAETVLRLDGDRILLDALSLSRGPARLAGKIALGLESRELTGRLDATDVVLEHLGLPPRIAEGRTDATIDIRGRRGEPDVDIDAASRTLSLAGTAARSASLVARIRGDRASARFIYDGGALLVSGVVGLRPPHALTGEASWTSLKLSPLLRALRSDLPASLETEITGQLSLTGDARSWDALHISGRATSVTVELADYRMETEEPWPFSLKQGVWTLERLRLRGPNTELSLFGTLALDEAGMDVQAEGAVDPRILASFFPGLVASGRAQLKARIRGPAGEPSLTGSADIDDGTLRLRDFPQGLAGIRGRLVFDHRTVSVDRLECLFGGAPGTIGGRIYLRGLSPESFELRGSGRGIRLRYPEGLLATVDAELSLAGTPDEQLLSGRVDVRDAVWSREFDLTTEILAGRRAARFEGGGTEALDRLRFDIQVSSPGSFRVRNSLATLDAAAELQLRGRYARPALLGSAEAVRGEVFFLGNRYRLTSGRVEFVDPSDVKPLFDLTAETRVRSYQILLRLVGTVDRFVPELSSDPPLRTVDILRLLAGASERDILLGSEEEEIAGVGVASLLTGRLTHEIGRRAERLFGLDRFSIDPFLVGQIANPTARVTLGKRISRDISITYSTDLNAATESIVLIEYSPAGPVSWLVSRDETGAFGVDIKFRKSF